MNSVWVWGLSKRATNRILIFNEKNQYLGSYYVSVNFDLPTELQNGILIFRNLDSNCDKNVASRINLKMVYQSSFSENVEINLEIFTVLKEAINTS